MTVNARIVIEDNLSLLHMSALSHESGTLFYHLVDLTRLVGFELFESDEAITAQDAIDEGKFGTALPPLRRALMRAYSLGSWRALIWTGRRYGRACLKAGLLHEAAYHSMLAGDKKGMEQLADLLVSRRDSRLIGEIVSALIKHGNLRNHFMTACELLSRILDLIPEDRILSISEWLLPRCREKAVRNGGGVMRAAWKVVRGLGERISTAESHQFIEAAISHSEWQANPPGDGRIIANRKEIAEAVAALVPSAPIELMPVLADEALLLATERKQDFDYVAAIEVLCAACDRGGDSIKRKISASLYAPGVPVNTILAQLTKFLMSIPCRKIDWKTSRGECVRA